MMTLVFTVAIFGLAIVGLAIGLLLRQRPLCGSCGNCSECIMRRSRS